MSSSIPSSPSRVKSDSFDSEDRRGVAEGKEEADSENAVSKWQKLSFEFKAPLPYKETEFPNDECWPDGKGKNARVSLQSQWKIREANFKSTSLPNAMIQKKVKIIRKQLLNRQENKKSWIKDIQAVDRLRSVRVQIIDEEFKAGRLFPMDNGSHGLCYSCGDFYPVTLLTAEHVQPQNSTKYAIIDRQKRFLEEFSKITDKERKEILEKTRAKEFIIIVDKTQRVTKKDIVIGSPIEKGEIPENAELKINEFFLRSYLNDISNLICMCSSCNTKTFHKSMEDKLKQYPLLTHEKAKQAFDFSLNAIDIMYTSSAKREGLGYTIIHWVNSPSEGSLFDLLKTQFFLGLTKSIPRTPLTPSQQEVKDQLIKKSPEQYKGQVEENIEIVILGMKNMGISERTVQQFLLAQWKRQNVKRELFSESPEKE